MEERDPISKEARTRDALLMTLSGGVIAIIGAIAEGGILYANNINVDAAIKMGGATLVGFGLAANGAVRLMNFIRPPKNSRK